MSEDNQKISSHQINEDSLNPFKYSEMIPNYEGKMIDEVNRMEGDLQTTEDYLQTTEDDLCPIKPIYLLPFIVPIISEHSNGFRMALLV